MTRSTHWRGSARTTPAIEAPSSSVGITTAVRMALEAPAQAAARARGWRVVGEEAGTERPVGRAVPDIAQALLRGVAERVVLVAALRERRDAARQRAAVRGEIHHVPRPPAHRPGRAVVVALEAHARLRDRAGGAERHA